METNLSDKNKACAWAEQEKHYCTLSSFPTLSLATAAIAESHSYFNDVVIALCPAHGVSK